MRHKLNALALGLLVGVVSVCLPPASSGQSTAPVEQAYICGDATEVISRFVPITTTSPPITSDTVWKGTAENSSDWPNNYGWLLVTTNNTNNQTVHHFGFDYHYTFGKNDNHAIFQIDATTKAPASSAPDKITLHSKYSNTSKLDHFGHYDYTVKLHSDQNFQLTSIKFRPDHQGTTFEVANVTVDGVAPTINMTTMTDCPTWP